MDSKFEIFFVSFGFVAQITVANSETTVCIHIMNRFISCLDFLESIVRKLAS